MRIDSLIESLVDDDKKVVVTMSKRQLIEYNLSLRLLLRLF
jgi:hypothetical protein